MAALGDKPKYSLAALAVPIFIENILRTSLLVVDQLMLNRYSEKAAAAMSSVNQFSFFIQLLYLMVAAGVSILVSQGIGAGRREEAGLTAMAGFAIMGAFAAAVSVSVSLLARPILGLYDLEPEVREMATRFLTIYGAGSFFMAMNVLQANILRAYGHPADTTAVNVTALCLTILGNALSLYGPFGLPVTGIAGVAASNVAAQFAAFWLMGVRIRAHREIVLPWRRFRSLPAATFTTILRVGVPTAGENLSYNVAQIVIVSFIARMGTASLAAYGIALSLQRYVFISGISIGSATQILVGYLVGARRQDEAYRRVWRYLLVGLAISVAVIVALNLAKAPILRLFTGDRDIVFIASAALFIALFHEPVRNINTIVLPALKGSGDTLYPALVGICFQWGVGVSLAWLFGLELGLGLPGVWMALVCDEWIRGLIIALRWRSGAWRSKSLVRSAG
jgi:putative MATE family efflux protein